MRYPQIVLRGYGHYRSAGAISRKPAPWATAVDHPVNPYTIAWLKSGKKPASDTDVEQAFGMPLEQILSVGGPLYSPDLGALFKAYNARLNSGAVKPAGAVSGDAPNVSGYRPVKPATPTKSSRLQMPIVDETPALAPASSSSAAAADPVVTLAAGGITCAQFLAMQPDAQANTIVNFGIATRAFADTVARAVVYRCSSASAIVGAPTARHTTIREPVELLRILGVTGAQFALMTCTEQFATLQRMNYNEDIGQTEWEQWTRIMTYAGSGLEEIRFETETGGETRDVESWLYWVRPGTYAHQPVDVRDPCQGAAGNCFFISSLASTAWVRPDIIARGNWRGGSADNPSLRTGQPTITFCQLPGVDRPFNLSARVPWMRGMSQFCDGPITFSHGATIGNEWASVYEKAFAIWVTRTTNDRPRYARNSFFHSDNQHPALNIAGGSGTAYITVRSYHEASTIWRFIVDHCTAAVNGDGKANCVMFAASASDIVRFAEPERVVPLHAYSLLGFRLVRGEVEDQQVVLRNPWGRIAPGRTADQRGEWLGLTLGVEGVGVMNLRDFLRKFGYITGNWYGTRHEYDEGTDYEWDYG